MGTGQTGDLSDRGCEQDAWAGGWTPPDRGRKSIDE